MTLVVGPRIRSERRISKLPNVDWALMVAAVALAIIGYLAIRSAGGSGDSDATKQLIFFVIGLPVAATVAMIDYRVYRDFLGLLYLVTLSALVLVLSPLGTEVNGTQGWFVAGGFSLQPAEFAKLALVVTLSAIFTGRFGSVEAPRILTAFGVLGLVAALVLLEGETGSVMVYCFVALGIFLVAGVPTRILLLMLASGIIIFTFAFNSGFLADYQKARITSFLEDDTSNSDASYQQRQSVTAIGSGGVTGQGYGEGPQTQNGFLPAKTTDFVFAVIAEELGFVGAIVVIGLQMFLASRILRVAQLARDGFGTLLCAGVFSMIVFQAFQNIAMTLKLMPITGIPLPFISYGGSSLLSSLLAIGLVQSVAVHRHRGTPS
ncbi:MAG: FtsW/RodA/SpoVE family cell cycle protein [Acidimicrobiales bacterium]